MTSLICCSQPNHQGSPALPLHQPQISAKMASLPHRASWHTTRMPLTLRPTLGVMMTLGAMIGMIKRLLIRLNQRRNHYPQLSNHLYRHHWPCRHLWTNTRRSRALAFRPCKRIVSRITFAHKVEIASIQQSRART